MWPFKATPKPTGLAAAKVVPAQIKPVLPQNVERIPMSTAPVVVAPAKQNGFKSFLDKLGSMFLVGTQKALQIEQALAPAEQAIAAAVSVALPVYAPEIATVQGIFGEIVKVQQIATAVGAGTGTGAQKLAAALPGVESVIMSDPLFKGKTIANLALYNAALTAITSSFADLGNALSDAPVTPVVTGA